MRKREKTHWCETHTNWLPPHKHLLTRARDQTCNQVCALDWGWKLQPSGWTGQHKIASNFKLISNWRIIAQWSFYICTLGKFFLILNLYFYITLFGEPSNSFRSPVFQAVNSSINLVKTALETKTYFFNAEVTLKYMENLTF